MYTENISLDAEVKLTNEGVWDLSKLIQAGNLYYTDTYYLVCFSFIFNPFTISCDSFLISSDLCKEWCLT